MKIKTSNLTGAALDWAVGKTIGVKVSKIGTGNKAGVWIVDGESWHETRRRYTPSTDWAQGGPIIEWEGLTIGKVTNSPNKWSAESFQDDGIRVKHLRYGPTPLIAAMRCLVASKLGDEVDVPEELT